MAESWRQELADFEYFGFMNARAFVIGGFLIFIFSILLSLSGFAQHDTLTALEQLGGDGYREGQYPGLGKAASEIFYSKRRITLSGYAEFSNVFNGGQARDVSSGDLELYFNQLYRVTPFIGIRLSKNWFWITELGFEYLEGNGESHAYFFPESYMDVIIKNWLSIRIGLQPLNIGYINNNEEPLLYLSVNRPETERLVLPSEWIEAGITVYGDLFDKFNYAIGITNGVLARDFMSPTWIRNGTQGQLTSFNRIAINAQINYLPSENITLSLSSYYNQSGRGQTVQMDGIAVQVNAPVKVISGYARWDFRGFSLIGMGIFGNLGETPEVYALTLQELGTGQVIGKESYGFYIEPSIDLFRLFGIHFAEEPKAGSIFTISHSELPIFVRYEQLDTHSKVDAELEQFDFIRSRLNIWTVGINYKPNHNIAVKFDVRFGDNLSAQQNTPQSETLYELGLGLEF